MSKSGCHCRASLRVTEERSRDVKRATLLTRKIRSNGAHLIRDRTYHLKTYHYCFVASELVDWLVTMGEADDRNGAILLGQLLVDTDYIHHVVDEHNFEDSYLFFRFRQDEPPELALQGPSVAFMKGEEGSLISLLARKRPVVGWTYYVFALSSITKTIFQFRSELDSAPMQCLSVDGLTLQPEHSLGSNRYIMHLSNANKEKVICLSADSSDTQFTWIEQFAMCGVKIMESVEEQDDKIKSAVSIFEFEALDINEMVVPLSRYWGHVTLIVNVASQ